MKHLKSVFFVSALLLSTTVYATDGGDRTFARVEEILRMQEASAAMLADIEKMPKDKQSAMVGEHMKMLGDVMEQLSKAKPDASLTLEQKAVWMDKHEKIVMGVLNQMRREHAMMFSASHNLN